MTVPTNDKLAVGAKKSSRDDDLDGRLQETTSSLYHVFGVDCQHKRCNLAMLDSSNILYVTGNCLVQYDLNSKRRRYLLGLDGGGIGCFLVDKDKTRVFVGNNALNGREGASICVYTLANFVLTHRLYGGAARGYKCLDLNAAGTKLASVSSFDYSLIIWDLELGIMLLQAKAFGQEVYKVAFSPYDDGILTTSGSGHISFWTVAHTFTGLKLQGKVGKFGKVEQSDIDTFVMTKDGKVITGSESGHLLLWEAGFVKCRFVCHSPAGSCSDFERSASNDGMDRPIDRPLHDGRIYFIRHDVSEQRLMTAGADGKIQWWCMRTIEMAEMNSAIGMDSHLEPIRVFFVGQGVVIGNIAGPIGKEKYIVMTDKSGGLLIADLESERICKRVDGHGGILVGIDVSPLEYFCVTACSDGGLRCWDYISKSLVCSTTNPYPCSAVRWTPIEIDGTGRTISVGDEAGVLRFVYINNNKFALRLAVKPHSSKITCIKFSRDGSAVATASEEGTVFIFRCAVVTTTLEELKLNPVGFVDCGGTLSNIEWRHDASGLTCSTSRGEALELEWGTFADLAPCQAETSYALNVVRRERRSTATSSAEVAGESTMNPRYYHTFACDGVVTLSGTSSRIQLLVHDEMYCLVGTYFSWDGKFVLTASSDGNLVVLCRLQEGIAVLPANDQIPRNKVMCSTDWRGAEGTFEDLEGAFGITLDQRPKASIQVSEARDTNGIDDCTINEALVRKRQAVELVEAAKKKWATQEVINKMRVEYLRLLERNRALPEGIKFQGQELVVDGEYVDILSKWSDKQISAVHERCSLEFEKVMRNLSNLRNAFVNIIDCEHFVVKDLDDRHVIQSFTTVKLSKFVEADLLGLSQRKSSSALSCPTREVGRDDHQSRSNIVLSPSREDAQAANDHGTAGNTYNTRKMMRLKRKKELQEKLSRMPDENSEDDLVCDRMRGAETIRGSYVVKTASDYVAPVSENMTAETVLESLVLLHSSIDSLKRAFNDRLLNLLQVRGDLISDMVKGQERVALINSRLGVTNSCHLILEPVEGGHRSTLLKTNSIQHPPIAVGMNTSDTGICLMHSKEELRSVLPVLIHASMVDTFVSGELDDDTKLKLVHEKLAISRDLRNRVDVFNESFNVLRTERARLGPALKESETKLLVLLHEVEILSKFKGKDAELLMNLNQRQQDRDEVTKLIDDCHRLLQSKEAELEALLAQDEKVLREMAKLVPESHAFHHHLGRIFARKITSDLYEHEGFDETDGGEDEDEDEDLFNDEADDSCPQGCDVELYDTVLELRESRLAIEQQLKHFQRTLANMKRTIDGHKSREKQISHEIELVKVHLRTLQLEKQAVVNEILASRALKVSQIYIWNSYQRAVDDVMMPDQISGWTGLGESVLFSNDQFIRLRLRIDQLKEENLRDRKDFKELQKEMVRLEKNKISKEDFINDQNKKAEEIQLLKFGQLVDIDALDKMTLSTIEDDLHSSNEEVIKANERILQAKLDHHKLLKEKLLNSTNENTALLNQLADLSGKNVFYERQMTKSVFEQGSHGLHSDKVDNMVEIRSLSQKASSQLKQINELRAEIYALERKTGHVRYPFAVQEDVKK